MVLSVTSFAPIIPLQRSAILTQSLLQVRMADEKGHKNLSSANKSRREVFVESTSKIVGGVASLSILEQTGFNQAAIAYSPNALSSSLSISTANTAPLQTSSGGNVVMPPMGLGTWAWGDSLFWGYDPRLDNELKEVFDYALERKIAFFDTAELYGIGRSEKLLAEFRDASGRSNEVSIATKFAAFPTRTKATDVVDACKASVKRLGGKPIDLYQVHFPNAWSNAEYWDGLADAYDMGLVKSVGVSNYGVDSVRAAHSALKARGIQLATNQIQLSLLYRFPIDNGLLRTCDELGVKVLAYSPLCLGFLTGKYNKGNLPSGPRKAAAKKLFEGESEVAFSNLISVMQTIANKNKNASLSQVALNWTRAKGTIPIPGARNLRQAKQNLDALNWNLTEDDVRALDQASIAVPPYIDPAKSPFAKKDIRTGLVMFDS